jgi:PBP1b-binding outer membrane lipoprotein LpoB
MKKLFPLLIIALFFSSCSSDEPAGLEVYNTEAFAYDLGDGAWEVNSTTRVKGFKQNEDNQKFTASLSFDVDLVKPSGEVIRGLVSKTEDKTDNEKMSDTELEVQLELDSTYAAGTYKLVFRVRDVLSEQADSSSAEFKIGEEEEI